MALKQKELSRKNKRRSIPSNTMAGFIAKRLLWLRSGNKVVSPKLLTQNTTMLKQTCKGKAGEAVSCCDWPSFSECQCQAEKLPKLSSFSVQEHQVEARRCEHRFFFKTTQQSVALCRINFEASFFTLKRFFSHCLLLLSVRSSCAELIISKGKRSNCYMSCLCKTMCPFPIKYLRNYSHLA